MNDLKQNSSPVIQRRPKIFADITDLHFGFNDKAERINQKFLEKVNKEVQPDCLLINGDSGIIKQKQLNTAFRNIRQEFPIIPIAAVFGNHDYWEDRKKFNCRFRTWENQLKYQDEILKKYDIHHPERMGPLVIDDVVVMGYDGWYLRDDPPSNDGFWLPHYIEGKNPHHWMQLKMQAALDKILYQYIPDHFEKKKIVITHFGYGNYFGCDASFNQNAKYLEFLINAGIDVICYGHTHMRQEAHIRKTRIFNPGGGYKCLPNGDYILNPEYISFEL